MLQLTPTFYFWQKTDRVKLSKRFETGEFTCPCKFPTCLTQGISIDLFDRLSAVREDFGHPIVVTSGHRCHEYQLDLAKRGYETAKGISQHEKGEACDIRPAEAHRMNDLLVCIKKHFTSIGVSSRFVHVDTRPGDRRWAYTK
jgi:uncharacterized protein YcbK (DUF882 family)